MKSVYCNTVKIICYSKNPIMSLDDVEGLRSRNRVQSNWVKYKVI